MAAAALLTFTPVANPNLGSNFHWRCAARASAALARLPSRRSQFDALTARGLDLSGRTLTFGRRTQRSLAVAGSNEESTRPDIEVEKEQGELKMEANEAQEKWKETLELFKEEALKMKEKSQEAYEEYSKKAMVVLKETSEGLKIHADKAREDLSIVAKQISEEGKVYLSTAAEKSPEPIKDIVETFASTDELKDMSKVRDFHLGIPYGAFLSIGGFLSFMMTGSISAIRFGVILGGALLALSVASLRSWKSGQYSELLLKGQAVIATIIFLREWRLLCQERLFSTSLMTLISGGMVAFYAYKIITDGVSKGQNPEKRSES